MRSAWIDIKVWYGGACDADDGGVSVIRKR